MKQHRINCLKCIHYHVTWDPAFPNGCKAMRFKSKEMPSAMVLKNTGHECLLFKTKSTDKNKQDKKSNFSEKA